MRPKLFTFIQLVLIMAVLQALAQFKPQYYNNGRLCIVRDEYVKIFDKNKKIIKTISLKPETTMIAGKNIVLVSDAIKVSGNGKYYIIEKGGWEVGASEYLYGIYAYIEYYNSNGKLLWKKQGQSSYITNSGDKIIFCQLHYSEEAKKYEYDLNPEINDPKHRESIVLVNKDGKELFRFTARIIELYMYVSEDVFSFAYTNVNKLESKPEIPALLNIHNRTMLSSLQDSSRTDWKYRYDGTNGKIYMRLLDGSTHEIMPEEWK